MWTDERVDLLKQLWNEGLSASQIANKLGEVTRNAVIGKVHRLGLSGRGTPARTQHSRPRVKSRTHGAPGKITQFPTMGSSALKVEVETVAEASPAPKPMPLRQVNTSTSDRVSILQLSDKTCRWPLGEPGTETFHFCGCLPKSGLPYCDTHARLAYQPLQDRRRLKVRGAA
ncbi:GcrA family cell cycle regulator [Rhodoligotrophos appendicifer]|uniref:GcrA family cell cycle regulator n=1 Tax=Rhodoligotrophos appendicifer TaxID=987056 RepID=UPI00117F1DF3|nr:GcrA family cell cycle regulator [Rhodoligotrophos appendicifer]